MIEDPFSRSSRFSLFSINLSVPRLVRWFAIAVLLLTIYQLLSSVGALAVLMLLKDRIEFQQLNAQVPIPEGQFGEVVRWGRAHLVPLMIGQVALIACTLFASIGLLRRRRWARDYFVLAIALIAAIAAALLVYQLANALPDGALFTPGWMDALLQAYAGTLDDAVGRIPTIALVVALLLIALLLSPDALLDDRVRQTMVPLGSAGPLARRALQLCAVGLLVPFIELAGLAFAFRAWLRMQNTVESNDLKRVVVALALGLVGVARDVALARLFFERLTT